MAQIDKSLIVIGGGIAGLCAAAYARTAGYDVLLLEQHSSAGGLATSWRRGDYTFETCLHWLVGSKPGGFLHEEWREVCDIDSLKFVNHDIFVTIETEDGQRLEVPTDIDLLERTWLIASPRDAGAICHFTAAIRHVASIPMPHPAEPWTSTTIDLVRMVPNVPLLLELHGMSAHDYGQRFTHPLLRRFFGDGAVSRLSVLALVFSMAWMSQKNAGYAIGGAQALIRDIQSRYESQGGRTRFDARVRRIRVEDGAVTAVELEDGEIVRASHVVSTADLHQTLDQMLSGNYRSEVFDTAFNRFEPFPSYVQVSLGVARDLSHLPGFLTLVLDQPIELDPDTRVDSLSCRIFHYDPTFAPPGKTAVTVMLPTYNDAWWTKLREDLPERYKAEKQKVADAVIARLERREPGLAAAVEVTDVATPASIIRYTGNWHGSMEGWLLTPATGPGLPNHLPGLKRFFLAGQWIQPGGGLPSGLMTARTAVAAMSHEDHQPFLTALVE